MSRGKVLVTAPYFLPVVDRFRRRLEQAGYDVIVHPVNERAEEAELLEVIGDIAGVICGDDRFTPRVLQNAPELVCISKWGTGIDSIDKAACAEHNVAICNTPNAFTIPVADSVLGYALAFCRNIASMDRAMKAGTWKKIPGFSLSEATIGIIGVGNIGRRAAKLFAAFDATVLGNDIVDIPEEVIRDTPLRSVPLDRLLAEADIVSVNCDLNPTSHHLINADTLAKMKPTAFLINAARGPIVCEPDLVAALQNGTIAGAGLDVFEHEPLPDDSPLRAMDNVLMAPHNTNSSPTAWERVHESTVSNLLRVLEERHGTR